MTVWNAVEGAVACDYGAEREMCVCGRIIVDEFLSFRGEAYWQGEAYWCGRFGVAVAAPSRWLRWLFLCGDFECAIIRAVRKDSHENNDDSIRSFRLGVRGGWFCGCPRAWRGQHLLPRRRPGDRNDLLGFRLAASQDVNW